jgi:hypothetical protein
MAGNCCTRRPTAAKLDVAELAKVLNDNKRHLVAQNMLEDGNTREEAENQIGILFEILKAFEDLQFQFDVADDVLKLKLATKLQTTQ